MAFLYCMCENLSCLIFRMVKIYTKKGDEGKTSLLGGRKLPKNSSLICAIGEIDELNSFIGWTGNACKKSLILKVLNEIQHDLYRIGAEIGRFKGKSKAEFGSGKIGSNDIRKSEKLIDKFTAGGNFRGFVRPGEKGEFSARIHICRAICRRAERACIGTARDSGRSKDILQYLNRLSDLLFVIAELK